MMNFGDHASDRGRVGTLHHLLHPAETEPPNRLAHVAGAADEAAYPFDFECFIFGGSHNDPKTALGRGRFFRSSFARFGYLSSIF